MNKLAIALLPVLALLGLAQCKKNESAPDSPVDQLPAATQTGANTFGCLLNGQPWTPTYNLAIGTPPPLRVTYDPTYTGGSLQIRAIRAVTGLPDGQYIFLDCSPLSKTGTYPISNTGPAGVYYSTGLRSGPCQEYRYYNHAPGFSMKGQLVITRLDMSAGIIAGTFSFVLAQTGCDTVKVTQGRFDKKL